MDLVPYDTNNIKIISRVAEPVPSKNKETKKEKKEKKNIMIRLKILTPHFTKGMYFAQFPEYERCAIFFSFFYIFNPPNITIALNNLHNSLCSC